MNTNASGSPRPARIRPGGSFSAVSLAFLFVLSLFAGIGLSGDSVEKDVVAPTLVLPDGATWGGAIYGMASDSGSPIIVTAATINGQPLAGSPDSTGTPTSNSFCFPIPRGTGLGYVRFTATDPAGNTRVAWVPIR